MQAIKVMGVLTLPMLLKMVQAQYCGIQSILIGMQSGILKILVLEICAYKQAILQTSFIKNHLKKCGQLALLAPTVRHLLRNG